jgi:hypothetical protein
VAAQALFKAGIEFRDKKDWERALSFFLQSRAIERRVSSTWNAAHCLNQLKRYPEALAFYEEVQRDLGAGLTAEKKAEIDEAIRDLRSKILIAEMKEPSGHYEVDGAPCGELPRKLPIYMLPGEHRLRIWQTDKPPVAFIFRGNPGEKISVKLPRPVLPKGQWFAQAFAGVGFGGTQEVNFVSFLAQTRDGYRFPNQLSLALVMGMFYGAPRKDYRKDLPSADDGDRNVVNPHFLRMVPLFGPYMGVSAGWEPQVDANFKASFRVGVGVMGVQTKSEIDIVRGDDRHSVNDEKGVAVLGRDVVRNSPAYTTFDVGLMFHRKQFYIGATVGIFVILEDGPLLLPMPVRLEENNRSNTITFVPKDGTKAYEQSFFFFPQLVVGFDP